MNHVPRRLRKLYPCCLGCSVAIIVIVLGILRLRSNIDQFSDLGKNPHDVAFKKILGISPPNGVSRILVGGYAPFNGDGVMTFESSNIDLVLKAIKQGPRGLQGPLEKEAGLYIVDQRPRDREFQEWLRLVGWERINHISKPEYYGFGGTVGWSGPMIVDRHRKLFFLYGQIL